MESNLRKKLPDGVFKNVPLAHSRRMGAIRSKGNRTTEARFRALLVRAGIRGWTMQTEGIKGRPDFYFPENKVAVFIDGCFWHGCPRCGHVPGVNRLFWKAKIERNQQRDRATDESLSQIGVRTIRFWEHDLKDCPKGCVQRLLDVLSAKAGRKVRGALLLDR
jgi:DNA mismatch endonuclease Vsr